MDHPPPAQSPIPRKTKAPIPRSLKNAVWVAHCGEVFNAKCAVAWCTNVMTPFDFEAGHNIPESKGGGTALENLRPICSQCNKSMGNRYTIDEFGLKFGNVQNVPPLSLESAPASPPKTKVGGFRRMMCAGIDCVGGRRDGEHKL